MAGPSTSGPADESAALSSRERAALAEIEAELAAADPALVRAMSGRAEASPTGVPVGYAVLLVLGMPAVFLMVIALPPGWRAVLAVLAVLMVLPAIALWAVERGSGT